MKTYFHEIAYFHAIMFSLWGSFGGKRGVFTFLWLIKRVGDVL
jgi:hypothetical protein